MILVGGDLVPMGTTLVTFALIYSCTICHYYGALITILSESVNVPKHDIDLQSIGHKPQQDSKDPPACRSDAQAELLVTHSLSLKGNLVCSQHWNMFHQASFPCVSSSKNPRWTSKSAGVSCEDQFHLIESGLKLEAAQAHQ